jgi:sugar lactone lactonase YvrE
MLARKAQMSSLTKFNPAWDISYAEFVPYNVGNISTAKVTRSFSVSGQEVNPIGVFFKPDGTKMYIIGYSGDDVNEYSLSTAWDISTASYTQNFSVASQETVPTKLFFKPDGTKMYVIGQAGVDINEYSLSSAWDVSTASYVQNFSVAGQETLPTGMFFRPDGTKMYIIGTDGGDVNEYSLSSAWDISTASYTQNFSVASQEIDPQAVFFKSDGTKMYVMGASGDDVNEYDLSTAWDISTASYVQNFSVGAQEGNPFGLFFSPDMLYMYVIGNVSDSVHQYTLIQGFSVTAEETSPSGLFFKPDGTKMYVCGSSEKNVNEYSLSTAWDVSTATYIQIFSVNAQDANPQDVFFKPDGTKMYIVGSDNDSIYEYSLSSAWNISTATYVQNFSVTAQETVPHGVFFKPDGTKMYIIGSNGDDVNEYSLSSAWDISTASYAQNFSVAAQDVSPQSVSFKTDGTKMYLNGGSGDDINEYSLSTAWDISTASYVQNFSIASQDISPFGLFFKPDGLSFWIVGASTDSVYQYNLVEPE